jgi:hypothetical protein
MVILLLDILLLLLLLLLQVSDIDTCPHFGTFVKE